MEEEKKKVSLILNLSKPELYIFLGVGLALILLPLLFTWDSISWISFKDKGEIGDAIGGITAPFIGFGGSILVYLALKAQIDANNKIQEQFEKQKKIDYQQNFENTFFNMLTIHHDIVKNIDFNPSELAPEHKPLSTYLSYIYNDVQKLICQDKLLASRDVFKVSLVLLRTLLKEDLLVEQRFVRPNPDNTSSSVHDYHLIEIFNSFQTMFEKKDILFLGIKENIRFQNIYDSIYFKLSTDFGHYFRNLYRIIKMVDEKKFSDNPLKDFKVKYSYTSIIRAQLSDDEIGWLFFNCLSKNGRKKFKPLLEKYSILKMVNIDNIDNETYKFYSKFYQKSAFLKPNGENLEEHIKKFSMD